MKLEKIRLDQTSRAQTLEEEAREAEQKARVARLHSWAFILRHFQGLQTGSIMKTGALRHGE